MYRCLGLAYRVDHFGPFWFIFRVILFFVENPKNRKLPAIFPIPCFDLLSRAIHILKVEALIFPTVSLKTQSLLAF